MTKEEIEQQRKWCNLEGDLDVGDFAGLLGDALDEIERLQSITRRISQLRASRIILEEEKAGVHINDVKHVVEKLLADEMARFILNGYATVTEEDCKAPQRGKRYTVCVDMILQKKE